MTSQHKNSLSLRWHHRNTYPTKVFTGYRKCQERFEEHVKGVGNGKAAHAWDFHVWGSFLPPQNYFNDKKKNSAVENEKSRSQ